MNQPIIKPTVGRKVWYRPCAHDFTGPVPMNVSGGSLDDGMQQPLDATIIGVWGDRCVNVLVTDLIGMPFPVLACTLLQAGDEPAKDADGKIIGRYVEWMPYQLGQARQATVGQAVAEPAQPEAPAAPTKPVGPCVTMADIEAEIASEFYFTAGDGVRGESEMGTSPAGRARSLELLTFCVLVLRNGFTVTGESACASPENFDRDKGRRLARQKAVDKVWPLLGYVLKQRLADEAQHPVTRGREARKET